MQKYDLPILTGIYVLLALFSFVISEGNIERWEAIILFSLTIIYAIFLIIREKKENNNRCTYFISYINCCSWYINSCIISF